ncbi:tetratricopeptide repeat protein, partial [Archangium sp.]|uniref:tetratricopeptide repeat protein n=1 Tax=Archangium sp. TaxID=1872627 RepID=UPI00389AB4AB
FTFEKNKEPVGHALVRAAIDWRRAGLQRPIPELELRQRTKLYLPKVFVNTDLTDDTYKRGLDWAQRPVSSQIPLLLAVQGQKGRAFEVFDYIADLLERQGASTPEQAWNLLIDCATPEETHDIGIAAYGRHEPEVAKHAFMKALASSHVDAAPMAAFNLGTLLAEQRDVAGARAAFQRAIDSGHSEVGLRAQELLRELSTREEADGSLHTENEASALQ